MDRGRYSASGSSDEHGSQFRHSDGYRYPFTNSHLNLYTDRSAIANTHSHADIHTDIYGHPDKYAYAYADAHPDEYIDSDEYTHPHRYSHGDNDLDTHHYQHPQTDLDRPSWMACWYDPVCPTNHRIESWGRSGTLASRTIRSR